LVVVGRAGAEDAADATRIHVSADVLTLRESQRGDSTLGMTAHWILAIDDFFEVAIQEL
jgi:hypothetical protein